MGIPLAINTTVFAAGSYCFLSAKDRVELARELNLNLCCPVDHQDGWLSVHNHSELACRSVRLCSLSPSSMGGQVILNHILSMHL